jgi:hypothetical protein
LNYTPNASRPDLNAPARPALVVARMGRILLLLTAVAFMTMPITERLWTWDHFLQGGQDFEMSTILMLSFLCLVLVLSKHGKQRVDSLFADWRHRVFASNHCHFGGVILACVLSAYSNERTHCPVLSMNNLPLQI